MELEGATGSNAAGLLGTKSSLTKPNSRATVSTRHSLNEGEEVPLSSPESIEAFRMLNPRYRKKKMEEMRLTEEEFLEKQFEIKTEIPEPFETKWEGPLVVRLVPPRDWPPRGREVDRKELEFIREAHKLQAKKVRLEDIENGVKTETDDVCLDRYKVFLKQYNEWVKIHLQCQ